MINITKMSSPVCGSIPGMCMGIICFFVSTEDNGIWSSHILILFCFFVDAKFTQRAGSTTRPPDWFDSIDSFVQMSHHRNVSEEERMMWPCVDSNTDITHPCFCSQKNAQQRSRYHEECVEPPRWHQARWHNFFYKSLYARCLLVLYQDLKYHSSFYHCSS